MNALMFLVPLACAAVVCGTIWFIFWWLGNVKEENDFRDYESGKVKRGRKK